MKKRYSTITTTDKSKKSFLKSNNTYVALVGVAFLVLVFISTCSPETFSEDRLTRVEKSTSNPDRRLQNAKNVEENLKNSYAILASEHSDICPKLIQEEIGSQVIERTAEVMKNNHCDYFLYLRDDQYVSVKVNDSQIEALLIVPTLHNFANGDYRVNSYDKHVIRLTYNGVNYKPKNLVYDVAVTVYN